MTDVNDIRRGSMGEEEFVWTTKCRIPQEQANKMVAQFKRLRPNDSAFGNHETNVLKYIAAAEDCVGTLGFWVCVFCLDKPLLPFDDNTHKYPDVFTCTKCEHKETFQETKFKWGFK